MKTVNFLDSLEELLEIPAKKIRRRLRQKSLINCSLLGLKIEHFNRLALTKQFQSNFPLTFLINKGVSEELKFNLKGDAICEMLSLQF